MEITVRKHTDEALMRRACEMTFNGSSHQSLLSIYKSEHSPARTQLFWIEFHEIPLFIATHFIRHHVGSIPFQLTRRDDKGNYVTFIDAVDDMNEQLSELMNYVLRGERSEAELLISKIQNELDEWKTKYDRFMPVKLGLCINAQSLIDVSKLRLCQTAHPRTIEVMKEVKKEIAKVDEALAKLLVRKCVYRGGICGEPKPCGFNHTPAFGKELGEYLSSFSAAQRPAVFVSPQSD